MNKILALLFLSLLITGHANNKSNWKKLSAKSSPFNTTTTAPNKPIQHHLITLHYISADKAKQWIQQHWPHAKDFTLIAINQQHCLWYQGELSKLKTLQQFIRLIDQPTQQIKIAARLLTVDKDSLQSLGVDFKTMQNGNLNMELPSSSTLEGSALIKLASLGDNRSLDLEISALEKSGHAQLIAEPTLITNNHQAAIIESGEEIPYQQKSSSGATNVAFKKAVLRLAITPDVVNPQQILCHVDIHQDKITPLNVQGVPIISTQHIKTNSLIRNRHTLVLGGIVTKSREFNQTGIPGLSHIPGLGALFRHTRYRHTSKQLVIFLTPSLVKRNVMRYTQNDR